MPAPASDIFAAQLAAAIERMRRRVSDFAAAYGTTWANAAAQLGRAMQQVAASRGTHEGILDERYIGGAVQAADRLGAGEAVYIGDDGLVHRIRTRQVTDEQIGELGQYLDGPVDAEIDEDTWQALGHSSEDGIAPNPTPWADLDHDMVSDFARWASRHVAITAVIIDEPVFDDDEHDGPYERPGYLADVEGTWTIDLDEDEPEPSAEAVADVRARIEARIEGRRGAGPAPAETLDAVDEALQAHYSERTYFDGGGGPKQPGEDWPFSSF